MKYLHTLFLILIASTAMATSPDRTVFPCLEPTNLTYTVKDRIPFCSLAYLWPNDYEVVMMNADTPGIREPNGDLPRFGIFRPAGAVNEPRPLVVLLHGGGSDRETPEWPFGTLDSGDQGGPCDYAEFRGGFPQMAALNGYIVVAPIDAWVSQWAGCGERQPDHGSRHYGSWIIEAAMHYMLEVQTEIPIDRNNVSIGGICGGSIGAVPNGLRDDRITKMFLDAHTDNVFHFTLTYPWAEGSYRHHTGNYSWADVNSALSYSYAHHLRRGGATKPVFLSQNRRDAISFSASNKELAAYIDNPQYFDQQSQEARSLEFDRDGPRDLYAHGNSNLLDAAALIFLFLEDRRYWLVDALGQDVNRLKGGPFTNDGGSNTFNTDNCIRDEGLLVRQGDGSGAVLEATVTLPADASNELSLSAWYLTKSTFSSPGTLSVLDSMGAVLGERDLNASPLLKNRSLTEVTFAKPATGNEVTLRITTRGNADMLVDFLLVSERNPGDWGLEPLKDSFPD